MTPRHPRTARYFGLLTALGCCFIFCPFISAQTSSESLFPADHAKVTLDLKGIDLVEALKILSEQGNMNLVIGGSIQGRVTLFLKEVEIQDAFDIILLSNGLAYDQRGDIVYVMTQAEYEQTYGERFGNQKNILVIPLKYSKAVEVSKALNQARTNVGKVIVDEISNSLVLIDNPVALKKMNSLVEAIDIPTVTKTYQLRYAKAKDLKEKVQEMLTRDLGSVSIDERTNHLIVTDVESKISKLDQMIQNYDVQSRQVLIDAKIVQVTLDDQFKLGVDWENVFRDLDRDFRITSKFKLQTTGTLNPGIEATVGSFGNTDYAMIVQALKTVGDTNTLSSPHITALNNEEAKILVGENRPYAINTVVQGSSTTTTASTLSFIEVGVKLYVTPTINQDGFVTMKIKPEVSSVTGTYEYGDPTTEVPIVSTTQAETSVIVQDGRTIIIAGLIKDERSGSIDKIPFLAEVPILGTLFRKTDNSVMKQELVIFLTPHIIPADKDYLDVAKSAVSEERDFTMPERHTFERRKPIETDPGFFKKARLSQDKNAKGQKGRELVKLSAASKAEEYYYSVKNKILDNIHFSADSKGRLPKGSLKIAFALSSNGSLISGPEIMKSTNPGLDQPSLLAVRHAAPFAPFPDSLKQPDKKFTIDFVFE